MSSTHTTALHELARLCGIEVCYRDGFDRDRIVPNKTLRQLLGCMNVSAATPKVVQQSLTQVRNRAWTRLIDEVFVVKECSRTPWCPISVPTNSTPRTGLTIWGQVESEDGSRESFSHVGSSLTSVGSRTIDGTTYVQLKLPLPRELSMGYYTLRLNVNLGSTTLQGRTFLIVAPSRCYLPARPGKCWGIAIQLYGLRSKRNWGIGDFRDLRALVKWGGAKLGVAMVGVNPLHNLAPEMISPYSPSSRLFHNPLYVDVEGVEEFRTADSIKRKVRHPRFQATLQGLRQSETVNYQEVHATKLSLLEDLYQAFRRNHLEGETPRARRFRRFLQQGGDPLHRFGCFQALSEHFGGKGWNQWPRAYRNPCSPAVTEFQRRNPEWIQFYLYVEWLCELQLDAVDRAAARAKMPFGIYQDLAVGIHPDGADAWVFQEQLARGMRIGAPPDRFNLSGQNWGLQPPLPQQLRSNGYQFIRETLHHTMQHGGLLRIDHALGLFRLFWIPEGKSGQAGAYVRYPTDELLAILAVESHRNQVTVVGEDLGTVTPAIRRGLSKAGLLSYRLLMFEKPQGRGFRRPQHYPTQAMVSATTHDLPTLRGFWRGRDIEVKQTLGMYPHPAGGKEEWVARGRDRRALLRALQQEGLLPLHPLTHVEEVQDLTDRWCRLIYAYLARTPCRVLTVPLEDLLGELEAPNLPGAPNGSYPVWELKLSAPYEQWRDDTRVRKFAMMVRRERKPGYLRMGVLRTRQPD